MYYFVRLLHKVFRMNAVKGSVIDRRARLTYDVQMVNSSILRYSYIGERSCILHTRIGAFCSIGDHCLIGAPTHALDAVSTSPVFADGRNIFGKVFARNKFKEYRDTIIDNDVWIGSGVFIKSGVHVGNGAIIGMGAVVTHDVGEYEIWAGNPAKLIRKRFDDNTIDSLKRTKWWDWNEEMIQKKAQYFSDVDKFITCEAQK